MNFEVYRSVNNPAYFGLPKHLVLTGSFYHFRYYTSLLGYDVLCILSCDYNLSMCTTTYM